MVLQGVLHRVFAFLVMPVLGYLLGATIFTHFWDKPDAENVDRADLAITALSCEQYGPITLRGFGFVHECRARVENRNSRSATIATVRGFLEPHLIGQPVVGREFDRGELTPERPYAWWAFGLLLLFAGVWLYVSIWVTRSGGLSRLRRQPDRAL
ncbi:hypothetical protein GCM10011609_59390 [Lentzea pudingi]|uniref:DUF3592 domain-containing protein n=1 Tax=Lentzea pudingi TaxID=1789439 RepID=A0ABQ2IHE6_9PSEU|nr:DUF6346 domain-containing protein [Lentzea pudingi]GGN11458.1 hypothetical protein GCM10011609_59390 [Lentzea pudingi]